MSRRTGVGLTRERVLQAGLGLVDREGVEALTMRRLGKELGVEAMSLYGYVANKQDLLDGVLARVYEEVAPVVTGTWEERLRAIARQVRHVLLRHPHVVGLVAARPVSGARGLHVVESALAELRDAGLDPVSAQQALTLVLGFAVSHVANQVGGVGGPGHDAEFEVGLDVIVAGVSGLIDSMV